MSDITSRSNHQVSRDLFLPALGVTYFFAFASLWSQIHGLIGSGGVIPLHDYLSSIAVHYGVRRFWIFPTLFWISASDLALHIICGLGVLASVLLILRLGTIPILFFLWTLYLSLVIAGGDFLSFQWDNLLLEVGFLSIFLAPLQFKPKWISASGPPRIVVWMFWFLLFKLIFASGVVKLSSGDQAWRGLSALMYHYETQPLPTFLSWYWHQLPDWFHRIETVLTLVLELVVPCLVFAPQRVVKQCAGCILIGFQILIMVTGNYCFFNLLSIALCLFLFDDDFWPKWLRGKEGNAIPKNWSKYVVLPLACVFFLISSGQLLRAMKVPAQWIQPIVMMEFFFRPFRAINNYGLFAVMTTERPEIIIEGSNDGRKWKVYEFKWKPGDVRRAPTFVAPHQPRLDWQMWFAALGNPRMNPWFVSLLNRLLQGSPPVLKLLEENPFPEAPPRFIRAAFYQYEFTNAAEKAETGAWWKRKRGGLYLPSISLKSG